ncbi:Histidine-containing phosphotransfer protein 3 [Bienertia sinuspersici]
MGSGAAAQLQKELVDYTASLFDEGFLNDQFTQIHSLQDESNPEFVAEVVNVFFKDSQRLLDETEKLLSQESVDYHKLGANMHQLKGSSSRCKRSLQLVRNEYLIVKAKLENFIKLEQQIVAAGGSIPKC